MEDTTTQPKPGKDNAVIFYILGGIVVTAIVVAGFLLYPKGNKPEEQAQQQQTQPVLGEQTQQPAAAKPAAKTGPIGSLACNEQFYNTVNGIAETYYLSVNGEAPQAAGAVSCTITASINNQVVATEQVASEVTPAEDRGGFTFKCSTKGLKLKANVPTKVVADLKDANGNGATCSRTFLLP